VIYLELRMVKIFRQGGPAGDLREDDALSGFGCPLREILSRRTPADEPRATPAGPNAASSA
jgi:hypothetical protein